MLPARMIMDTGCGYHVVSEDYARAHYLKRERIPKNERRSFMGVGGVSDCHTMVRIPIEELGEAEMFYVAGMSPALTSVGRRCQDKGYSFVWPFGEAPYFIFPNGNSVA